MGCLAAGVVVIWAGEATGGCTTRCCSAEFATVVRGAVVFSAIVGGPALACAGLAETATVAAIPSAEIFSFPFSKRFFPITRPSKAFLKEKVMLLG